MSYFVVTERCNGCLACVQNCPATALKADDQDGRRTLLHNMSRCARCGNCWRICPMEAIEFRHLLENRWEPFATFDLVHCRVCGEALYTEAFGACLGERLEARPEPLCSRHTDGPARLGKAHFNTYAKSTLKGETP